MLGLRLMMFGALDVYIERERERERGREKQEKRGPRRLGKEVQNELVFFGVFFFFDFFFESRQYAFTVDDGERNEETGWEARDNAEAEKGGGSLAEVALLARETILSTLGGLKLKAREATAGRSID